ncbi:hypothetical protein KJR02_06420 [Methanimicrococcus blatticola]|nr:hypothetical protein [Methanimicrococcus blatticola]
MCCVCLLCWVIATLLRFAACICSFLSHPFACANVPLLPYCYRCYLAVADATFPARSHHLSC